MAAIRMMKFARSLSVTYCTDDICDIRSATATVGLISFIWPFSSFFVITMHLQGGSK